MHELRVLLVDDDTNIRNTLYLSLTRLGHKVVTASSVQEALQSLSSENFDLVLTDFKMEEATGLDLIVEMQKKTIDIITVVMTAYASYENAVEVIKEGAFDYLPKPFNQDQLKYVLRKVQKIVELKKENQRLKNMSNVDYFYNQTSDAIRHLGDFIRRVAPTDATVLITGDSGTGKSLLAKEIHDNSSYCDGPFIEVHCTTLPSELIESELFGHEKGSFTGAHKTKQGKIQQAEGGTIFLDEIGELPPNGQAKLLRFIQEKVIDPVGSNKSVSVDARIIAATNKDLSQMVEDGKFREDLYYRLNMFECLVPALRYRRDDIPVLVKRFIAEISSRQNLEYEIFVPDELKVIFQNYDWPGNVRELKNVIERLCFLAHKGMLSVDDLPKSFRNSSENKVSIEQSYTPQMISLEEVERRHIKFVLEHEKNLDKAAETLGITSVTLWRKRKQYGLP